MNLRMSPEIQDLKRLILLLDRKEKQESQYYSKHIDLSMLRGCQILGSLTQKESGLQTKLKIAIEVAKI